MMLILVFLAMLAMFCLPLYYLTQPKELGEMILYDITNQTPTFWLFVILVGLVVIGIFIHKQIK